MNKQQLCDNLYDINNVSSVYILISPGNWEALKSAEPSGGRCNHAYTGKRYEWYETEQVEISGTIFPSANHHRFPKVGISKKSYCGSFSKIKPGLKLDFSEFEPSNEDVIEDLIGTKFITLNNSLQDLSYIRQPLGYFLFNKAGLPYSRCNFAHVYVNGDYIGLYINVEPIKKRYIQHNFRDNDKGNLYEIEDGEDFDQATIDADRISFEGFSKFDDKKDLNLSVQAIKDRGLEGVEQVIDVAQFIRFFAMEYILKHWDGYTDNLNNAYIYNDVKAVKDPTINDVKFKFIPWGLDRILQEGQEFQLGYGSGPGRLVRQNSDKTDQLKAEIRNIVNTIFSQESYENVLQPYIDGMEETLTKAGITKVSSQIETVRREIKQAGLGALQALGESPAN